MNALILTSAAAAVPPAEALALKVGGVTPFSATDYPGQLAAVVFVQGCPWRCGYCHNPHLQNRSDATAVRWADVLALLRRRAGLIDAVVFSGGEPTLDAALPAAIRQVRALGFGIGLHSAGIYPRRLTEVLPLVDWVGIDIKATPPTYDAITGVEGSAGPALTSAQVVLASGVAHEFRTTVHPSLHSSDDILALAETLSAMGVRHYALQLFRSIGCVNQDLPAFNQAEYPGATLLAQLRALFPQFTLRTA